MMIKTRTSAICLGIAVSFYIAAPALGTDDVPVSASSEIEEIVKKATEETNEKLAEEADRVPGLKYDDISRISRKIPGNVQIPDPTSDDYTSRAVSVPGGLVSEECRHFARGYLAKTMFVEGAGLSEFEARARVTSHLQEQRVVYAKMAGKRGLKRSDVAIHDADCPVCGPINAAEIACHVNAVKKSPIRELVMFDYASDTLRGGYSKTIENVRAILDSDPQLKVALIGRASIPGGPITNFALSARRITSVWHGISDAGIPVDRIIAIPIGEDEPHIDLQLAIDYGLEDDFAALGQQSLNQSVYIVVFRPSDEDAPEMVLGDPAEAEKQRSLIKYLSDEQPATEPASVGIIEADEPETVIKPSSDQEQASETASEETVEAVESETIIQPSSNEEEATETASGETVEAAEAIEATVEQETVTPSPGGEEQTIETARGDTVDEDKHNALIRFLSGESDKETTQ